MGILASTVLHPWYLDCLKNEQPKHFSNKTSGPRLFAVGDDTGFIGILLLAIRFRLIRIPLLKWNVIFGFDHCSLENVWKTVSKFMSHN